MKTKTTALTSIILAVILTLSLFPAIPLAASDYSGASAFWWSYGDLYNSSFALSGAGNSLTVTPGDDASISYTSSRGSDANSWYPVTAATPAVILPLSETSVAFSLDSGFSFDNFNGYNGYISFMWSYGWSDASGSTARANTLPSALTDAIASDNSVNGGRCGYANQMIRRGLYGISVTFIPDPAGGSDGTRKVTGYQIYVKNTAGGTLYSGTLSSPVDLSQKNVFSIVKNSSSDYSIKLGGITIKSLDLSSINYDGGFLSTAVLGGWCDSNTNFTIYEINGYTSAVIASPAYSVEKAIRELPALTELGEDDYSRVLSVYDAYTSLAVEYREWITADSLDKLLACYAAANGAGNDTGRALADGVECDLSDAAERFASGDVSVLTLLSGSCLVTPVTVGAGQRIIVKTGAEYIPSSLKGSSKGQLFIEESATIYQWNTTINDWKERKPGVQNITVSGAFIDDGQSGAIYTTNLAIQSNEISDTVTEIGIIYIPASAITDSNGDNKKNQLDIDLSGIYDNQYAIYGSMNNLALPSEGISYFSASMLAQSSLYAYTMIECWYIGYTVGDNVRRVLVYDNNTDKYGAYKLKHLLGIEEEPANTYSTSFTVSSAFDSDMVIQRDKSFSVWGFAPEAQNGSFVTASFGSLTCTGKIADGKWKIVFGNTFSSSAIGKTLTVSGNGVSYTYSDILVGDVYFIIGGSNVAYSTEQMISDRTSKGLSSGISYSDTQNVRMYRASSSSYASLTGMQAQGTAEVFDDVMFSTGWKKPSEYGSSFSALGYSYACEIANNTGVPVGAVEIDASDYPLVSFAPNELNERWGKESNITNDGIYRYSNGGVNYPLPSRFVYNQQIHPLTGFSIAGMIWYQGEYDNANNKIDRKDDEYTFASMLSELIEFYRSDFENDDFPVYAVEFTGCFGSLGASGYFPTGNVRAELGLLPSLTDNFYLSASGDLFADTSWQNSFVPYCKKEQASRLAGMALSGVYNKGDEQSFYAPTFESVSYNGKTAVININNPSSGLKINDINSNGLVIGLEVFTADGWSVCNSPVLGKNTITVTADREVLGVRYNVATSSAFPYNANIQSTSGVPLTAFYHYNNPERNRGAKFITFSWDDGTVQDHRLVNLLNTYGIKGTFFLNSGTLDSGAATITIGGVTVDYTRIAASTVPGLYTVFGHEVGSHSVTHPDMSTWDDTSIYNQTQGDCNALSAICGMPVTGFAYPGGIIASNIYNVIKNRTSIEYCRTITSTYGYSVPDDWLLWNPTCHFLDANINSVVANFLASEGDENRVLYIWGHSFECDLRSAWDELENLLRLLSGYDNVNYATNGEVYDFYN